MRTTPSMKDMQNPFFTLSSYFFDCLGNCWQFVFQSQLIDGFHQFMERCNGLDASCRVAW
jgi:hypothetical protein